MKQYNYSNLNEFVEAATQIEEEDFVVDKSLPKIIGGFVFNYGKMGRVNGFVVKYRGNNHFLPDGTYALRWKNDDWCDAFDRYLEDGALDTLDESLFENLEAIRMSGFHV